MFVTPCTLAFQCIMWTIYDSPRLLGSLGPNLLMFTLDFLLDLHLVPWTTMSHPTNAHHEPRDTITHLLFYTNTTHTTQHTLLEKVAFILIQLIPVAFEPVLMSI